VSDEDGSQFNFISADEEREEFNGTQNAMTIVTYRFNIRRREKPMRHVRIYPK
jgi:hypothetical protein